MKRLAVAVLLLSVVTSAEAYVGPGMGLGVMTAVLGFLAAIVLALAGMVWYPVKRMIRARRGAASAGARPPGTAGVPQMQEQFCGRPPGTAGVPQMQEQFAADRPPNPEPRSHGTER